MRFMSMIKSDESMPYGPPPPALFAAMAEFGKEGAMNGTMIESGGLGPSAMGAIVSLVNGSITAVDGPFTEAQELIGGYAVLEVRTRPHQMGSQPSAARAGRAGAGRDPLRERRSDNGRPDSDRSDLD